MPRYRVEPEDFVVEEVPLYEPTGEGQHTYLWVEKRLRTTDEIARQLARAAAVRPREVGYAGRKDRRAVTRQRFSVPGLDPEEALALELDGARVLEAIRHRHRLRLGQLVGNRFRLVVREVAEEEARGAEERLAELVRRGIPNRYGPQRFGRHGDNAERGLEILRSKRVRGDRRKAWLMVSALQSQVFNRVLERRAESYDRLLAGDVAMIHSSGGLFRVDDPAAEAERAERFEISPTGPIFGGKMKKPAGEVAELEAAVMTELGLEEVENLEPPRGIRLDGSRRPLRIEPRGLEAELRDDRLELAFELPSGAYASVLLEELFPAGLDEGPSEAVSDRRIG